MSSYGFNEYYNAITLQFIKRKILTFLYFSTKTYFVVSNKALLMSIHKRSTLDTKTKLVIMI